MCGLRTPVGIVALSSLACFPVLFSVPGSSRAADIPAYNFHGRRASLSLRLYCAIHFVAFSIQPGHLHCTAYPRRIIFPYAYAYSCFYALALLRSAASPACCCD
ncbi:hypothetical protein BV25DRAFT_944293 [Artomyces pyxidatus]|uniref:Uncharacterized protein n=1 Tax=Artomyces pyxidatus TaxID=48021 RepID=A0ACB8SWI2_9AGAM|nr:hypothetical protein BV25DRAFT_944293 [Artomyces pyxidatus]